MIVRRDLKVSVCQENLPACPGGQCSCAAQKLLNDGDRKVEHVCGHPTSLLCPAVGALPMFQRDKSRKLDPSSLLAQVLAGTPGGAGVKI